MSVSTATTGSATHTGLRTAGPGHRCGESGASRRDRAAAARARRADLRRVSTRFETLDTAAETRRSSTTPRTTGLAKGIVHAHRNCSPSEFEYCHDLQPGERFHGWRVAWAAGTAAARPWPRAVQCVYQREAALTPKQLAFLSRHGVTNVFGTPTAIRSMMSIGDARTRYPQRFRIVGSAGEPLNRSDPLVSRAVRDVCSTTTGDRVLPLCGNFPFMEVREVRWAARCPATTSRSSIRRRGRARRTGEICLRARSNPHYPSATGGCPRRASRRSAGVVPHQGCGADDDAG